MLQTVFIEVSGKVQGVFYRQSAREKARSLGITGTVANTAGGTVQMMATGTKEGLDALINWCRQGPPKAKVSNVRTEERPLQVFDAFEIDRDG